MARAPLAAAAAAVLLLGLASIVALTLNAGAQEAAGSHGTKTMEPGQGLHLLPASMAKGDSLSYEWQVESPPGGLLYFSIHEHVGAQQVNIHEGNFTLQNASFVAPRDGSFSVLWINNGNDTTTLRYATSLHHPNVKTPLPWILGPLAAAGVAGLGLARRRRP